MFARPRWRLALLLALPLTSAVVAEEAALPPLQNLMDPASYEAAGLGRLTDAEREALRVWLEAWRAGRAEAPPIAGASEPPAAPAVVAPAAPAVAEVAGEVVDEVVREQVRETVRAEVREEVLEEVREEVRQEVREEVREELAALEEGMAAGEIDEESAGREGGWLSWLGRGGRDEVEEEEREAPSFTTRIDGRFGGWDGRTVFLLQNGQIWQQRRDDFLDYDAMNPEVILKRNFMGFYSMEVPEAGRTVLVRRVR